MSKSLKLITCINGFRACGKTKLVEILRCAFNNLTTVGIMDVSDAIRYYLKHPEMPYGRELKEHRHVMELGGIIPDGHLIYHVCMEYLDVLDKTNGTATEHLLLAGGMRTPEEVACFDDFGVSMRVIHVRGTYNDMLAGVQRRKEAGVHRDDSSSPEKLQRGWNDYVQYTIPTLVALPKGQCHEIQFSWTMRKKVEKCIEAMDILSKNRKKLHRRISSHNHPVWHLIQGIDNPPVSGLHHLVQAAHSDKRSFDPRPTNSSDTHRGFLHTQPNSTPARVAISSVAN